MKKNTSTFYIKDLFNKQLILIITFLTIFFNVGTAQITFNSPASGTVWQMGTNQTIQVVNNSGSALSNAEVAIFIDGSVVGFPVLLTDIGTGTVDLSWYIELNTPDAPSADCQLKVFDENFDELAVSEVFELSAPSPQISQIFDPGENEYWYAGQDLNILWKCYSISAVDIEYSTNNGTDWTTLETNYSVSDGNNFFNWSITGITGTNENSLIRISESSNPTVSLNSDNFTLAESPKLSFVSPASGTIWQMGTNQIIQIINNSGSPISNAELMLHINGSDAGFPVTLSDIGTGTVDLSWDIDLNIPDAPSANCQLKVFDNHFNEQAVSEVFELSAPSPQISQIVNPEENEYWHNSQNLNILWRSYSISAVDIEYSTNNGTDWTIITTGHTVSSGNNSYNWLISGITGINENSLIRISETSNPAISLNSSIFTLAESPQVSFTTPSSGANWELGSNQIIEITNNTDADVNNTHIMLFIDGMQVFDTHFDLTLEPGNNNIEWDLEYTYPDAPSSNCQLKIYDHNFNELAASETFELSAASPQISQISSPAENDYWYNGNSFDIYWRNYSVSAVNIEYSTNNGTDWTTIENDFAVSDGTNSYSWNVSGFIGINPNSLIRISESTNSSVFLNSDNFTLAETEQISFTAPTNGTSWELGSDQTIVLVNNTGENINHANIQLYIDGMQVHDTHHDLNLDAGINNITWNIDQSYHDAPSSNCQLIIFDNNFDVLAISEIFELSPQSPQISGISSPSETDYLYNGNSFNVSWENYSISAVDIEYSTNNGTDWTTIETNYTVSDGFNSYSWSVSGITGENTNSLIRISETSNPGLSLNSDNFTLAELPQIAFNKPDSESSWKMGSSQTVEIINNTGDNIYNAMIQLHINGSEIGFTHFGVTIETGTNTFPWNIYYEISGAPSSNCQLKVTDMNLNEIASSETFELLAPDPVISEVLSPEDNEYWYNGSVLTLIWRNYGIDFVDIEYSVNNGDDWLTIETDYPVEDGTNFLNWTVTGITGINPSSLIRFSESSNPSLFKNSDIFTLAEYEKVSFTEPNSSTSWEQGTQQQISFTNNLNTDITDVLIFLYINDMEVFPVSGLLTITPGTQTIAWDIPLNISEAPSPNCQLKAVDMAFNVFGESEVFELSAPSPQISEISAPDEGDYWYNNFNFSINWKNYSVSEVDIEYSTNNGTDWTALETNYSVSDGNNSYSWDISGITGINPNSLIRISESGNPAISLISDNFTLAEEAQLTFSQPTSSTVWELGTEQHIFVTNNTDSDITNTNFLLTIDGFGLQTVLHDITLTPGLNDIVWEIEYDYVLTPSANCSLRIRDESQDVLAESETFELSMPSPQISEISRPSEFDYLYNGYTLNISWKNYSISAVDIEYSTNNGTDWTTIETNYSVSDGNNYCEWLIDNITGINPNSIVRISETSNPDVYLNSSNFTLAENARVTITQPTASSNWELGSEQHILLTNNTGSEITDADLKLYIDGMITETIVNDVTITLGANNVIWMLEHDYPFAPSANCTIKALDSEGSELGISETFEITPHSTQISEIYNPVENDYWFNGNDYTISWRNYGISEVDIDYSINNGSDWETITTAYSVDDGYNSYEWSLSGISGVNPTSLIRVSETLNPSLYLNSANFYLSEFEQLIITQPVSSTVWELGTEQHILITNNSGTEIQNVFVKLYIDNEEIIETHMDVNLTSGSNDLVWNIEESYISAPSDNCLLKVTDMGLNELAVSESFELTEASGINTLSSGISIYPNPTSGKLFLKFDKPLTDGSVEIKDIIGKTVYKRDHIKSNFFIDLETDPGIYFITVSSDNRKETFKIIKK